MKPAPFTYHRPESVADAVATLAAVDGEGKVLAGGQSLVPLLSMRLAAPEHLVDINAVPGLDRIEVRADQVRVGALVRDTAVEQHEATHAGLPVLRQALAYVGHPTIRNRGTVVGSICHADPAAELPAVLALLDGRLVAVSTHGEREVPATELFTGPLETSLRVDELATAAMFPVPRGRVGTAVVEVARRHGDYAVCGVVALVELGATDDVVRARAAYISVADRPVVLDFAGDDWSAAAACARERFPCTGDIHASADYRRHLVGVLTKRALAAAAANAGQLS